MARMLIVGGTFNPVHTGHLRLAIEASEAVQCDHVSWLPSYAPPHKNDGGILPFGLRLEILRAATAGFPNFSVSDIECRLGGASFTWDTLQAFAALHPATEFFFVLGQEEFARMPKWYRGQDVPLLTGIVVAARTGLDVAAFQHVVESTWPDGRPANPPAGSPSAYRLAAGHEVILLPLPRLEISASLVRHRWLEGRDIRLLVPDAVEAILQTHGDLVTAVWNESCAAPAPDHARHD
jgi:nicotinate-nucleotide adenylyltransferase